MSESAEVPTVGEVLTFTYTVSLAKQPAVLVAVTIYRVFTVGFATGLRVVAFERLVAGCHW